MATRQEIESKLTPAAKQALDELADDYRSQLLIGAADSASRLGDLREVAVHDIMSAVSRQRSRLFGVVGSTVERALRTYAVLGVLTGIAGLAAFAGREIVSGRRLDEQLPLLVALSGFVASATSYFLLSIWKNRSMALLLRRPVGEFGPADAGSFLLLWRDIELALRGAAAARLGESTASAPISRLVDQLSAERLLSAEDQMRLRRLLTLRNSVAHGQATVEDAELATARREAERLLGHLRSLESPAPQWK
jgi:hypothetical protein